MRRSSHGRVYLLLISIIVVISQCKSDSDSEDEIASTSITTTTTRRMANKRPRVEASGFNPRRQEIDEFMATYRAALNNENLDNSDSLAREVERLIEDAANLIVFDCSRPSYMDLKRKTHIKSNQLLAELHARANCSKRHSSNIWVYEGDPFLPVTYNFRTRTLTSPPLHTRQLIPYFVRLDRCHQFMRFLRHPGYFIRGYRKSSVCPAKKRKATNSSMSSSSSSSSNDSEYGGATDDERTTPAKVPKQTEAKFFQQHRFHPRPGFRPGGFHPGFRFPQQQWGGFRPMGGCIGGQYNIIILFFK